MFLLMREREISVRGKHWSIAFITHPDWGLNPQPFGIWDDVPTNWATLPGLELIFVCDVRLGWGSFGLCVDTHLFQNYVLMTFISSLGCVSPGWKIQCAWGLCLQLCRLLWVGTTLQNTSGLQRVLKLGTLVLELRSSFSFLAILATLLLKICIW